MELKHILKEDSMKVDRIDLAQDKIQWRDLLNTVINFRVPKNPGNFLTSRKTINV
jgi:hypothetical protein